MKMTQKHPFYALPLAAAVLAITSVACNNGDYRTSNGSTPDSNTALNPAGGATPAGQPATTRPAAGRSSATPRASTDMDTIDNMGSVRPSTSATKPDAGKEGVAGSGAATPPARIAHAHNRKKATATIVVTSPMPGATAPQFPGGQRALDTYVNDHINYPQDAIDKDVTGIVRVSFVVDEHGRITRAKLVSSERVGDGLDEEALRVVNNMPEWKPGTFHGKRVKTRMELPISFQVES